MLGDFATTDPDAARAAEAHGVLAVPLEGGLTRFVVVNPERMRCRAFARRPAPVRCPCRW
ncbi:hypothetical protein HNP84_003421 [Thermocatellispora tengchongensis]|uniref:Uncharacterized protein n=1 Tax=Thermocatellispora tengchongensis TaxID=1073253 RepID=A0A840PCE4_9ACTN|nr:hypothetical protein [Thermocatellispora tengchongensis]MBB5133695.1 hypothetical protein [Thermocatellispora tengchongensis]